jgi:hypothetical protein
MRLIWVFALMVSGLAVASRNAAGDEESCAACDRLVQVSGEFFHSPAAHHLIQGAVANDAGAFGGEIAGSNFTVTVSELPAGKYAIVIGEVETLWTTPGRRIFDVVAGDQPLATNFDIVAVAGGADKVCYITGEVDHLDDSIHGPLAVTFTARLDNAKFNT